MNFESLPLHIQKFINDAGMRERVAGIALIRGDTSDNEALRRYLLPRLSNVLISHYTSWDRLEEALRLRSLCMKRVDQFVGDVRDGTFPEANTHSESAMDTELHSQLPIAGKSGEVFTSHEQSRSRAYAHCWFEGWTESNRMWKDYGWNGSGVCILTRSRSLIASAYDVSEEFHISIGGCFYRDDHEPIPSLVPTMPLFCKRRCFSTENEVRLLAQINEQAFRRKASVLEWIPLRTFDFVERLILGPRMSAEIAKIVKITMKQILPSAVVLPSALAATQID